MKQNFQLHEVLNTVWKNKSKVLTFTILGIAIGTVLTFILPKLYESSTHFVVKSPLNNSRPSTFVTDFTNDIPFETFANEKEIDIVEGIINSHFFHERIAHIINSEGGDYMSKLSIGPNEVKKSFKFKRNAQRVQQIAVRTSTPKLSLRLSQIMIQELNSAFNHYFVSNFHQKKEMLEQQIPLIKEKIADLDQQIEFTRSKYGLNTELAPSRAEALIQSTSSVKPGTEELYNLIQYKEELLKSSVMIERSIVQYTILSSENHLDMLHIVSEPYESSHNVFPQLKWMLILGGLLGFFVSVLGIIVVQIPRK